MQSATTRRTMRSVTMARPGWPSGRTETWRQWKQTTGDSLPRRATPVPLARRVCLVRKEQRDHRDLKVQQVRKVHREQLDHKALRARPARPEQTGLLAPKGRKE